MWYEILPKCAIVVAALSIPQIVGHFDMAWIHEGNSYLRSLTTNFNKDLYQRDLRLNGNPYKIMGLDNIPDAKQ